MYNVRVCTYGETKHQWREAATDKCKTERERERGTRGERKLEMTKRTEREREKTRAIAVPLSSFLPSFLLLSFESIYLPLLRDAACYHARSRSIARARARAVCVLLMNIHGGR